MLGADYGSNFYEERRDGVQKSAAAIVPVVLSLFPVTSVVDVGCGEGDWLSVFERFGVRDITGIDGNHVDPQRLRIPKHCFHSLNLARSLRLPKVFDLAVSLEVAEHLPVDSAAAFVDSLTRLAPAVLFSAAIPFQGGVHHVNEQWPDWWASLFGTHGYLPVDCIRKRIWTNQSVDWWYVQNTLLSVKSDFAAQNPALETALEQTDANQLSIVHPRKYIEALAASSPPITGVKSAIRILLGQVRNSFRKRFLSRGHNGSG